MSIEEFKMGRFTVTIEQDSDPQSPQEEGDTGLFLVARHRDFYVPEPGEERITETAETLVKKYRNHWAFPIEAYIHSGVALAFSHQGNFPDRSWDVSQVGFIFASKEEWRLRKSATKAAKAYMETWNQYLSGDVYGYIIRSEDGKEESCWGFYGLDYCKEAAREAAESMMSYENAMNAMKPGGAT